MSVKMTKTLTGFTYNDKYYRVILNCYPENRNDEIKFGCFEKEIPLENFTSNKTLTLELERTFYRTAIRFDDYVKKYNVIDCPTDGGKCLLVQVIFTKEIDSDEIFVRFYLVQYNDPNLKLELKAKFQDCVWTKENTTHPSKEDFEEIQYSLDKIQESWKRKKVVIALFD